MLSIFDCLCRLVIFAFKINIFKIIVNTNSLSPDQARPFVGPELSANCLLRLSNDEANGKELIKVKHLHYQFYCV